MYAGHQQGYVGAGVGDAASILGLVETNSRFVHVSREAYSSNAQAINKAMWALGVKTKRDDEELRCTMAYGMFDTRGRCVLTDTTVTLRN